MTHTISNEQARTEAHRQRRLLQGACVCTLLAMSAGVACDQQRTAKDVDSASEPSARATDNAEEDSASAPVLAEESFGPELSVPIAEKSGSGLAGSVSLVEATNGVTVHVKLSNVEPGLHGVHFHEKADCSALDAKSAGGHFNPGSSPHGLPSQPERHLGDLGNITVDSETRTGELTMVVHAADLSDGGEFSFLNRALIVHADPDTGEQPTGGSGERIGCAEVTFSADASAGEGG